MAVAAGVIWLGFLVMGVIASGAVGLAVAPFLVAAFYLLGRIIQQRLGDAEDRHYDSFEK